MYFDRYAARIITRSSRIARVALAPALLVVVLIAVTPVAPIQRAFRRTGSNHER
jgi:hypothetical protein